MLHFLQISTGRSQKANNCTLKPVPFLLSRSKKKNSSEKESARLRVELKLFNLNSGRNLSIDKDIKIIIIQIPDG